MFIIIIIIIIKFNYLKCTINIPFYFSFSLV